MAGRRISLRRKWVPPLLASELFSSPECTGGPEGLAVYRVMEDTHIEGMSSAKRGQIVLLPYTEEFWGNPNLLLLREVEK